MCIVIHSHYATLVIWSTYAVGSASSFSLFIIKLIWFREDQIFKHVGLIIFYKYKGNTEQKTETIIWFHFDQFIRKLVCTTQVVQKIKCDEFILVVFQMVTYFKARVYKHPCQKCTLVWPLCLTVWGNPHLSTGYYAMVCGGQRERKDTVRGQNHHNSWQYNAEPTCLLFAVS